MKLVDAVELAKLLVSSFRRDNDCEIEEPKLHRMLYLMQRESLIRRERPLFKNAIYAWQLGPVVDDVRSAVREGALKPNKDVVWSDIANDECFKYVVSTYSKKTSLSLRRLTCAELSWVHARQSMRSDSEPCEISISDIEQDAARVRMRREALQNMGGEGDEGGEYAREKYCEKVENFRRMVLREIERCISMEKGKFVVEQKSESVHKGLGVKEISKGKGLRFCKSKSCCEKM